MNKYLRNWLLNSNVPFLRDIGTRSVRKAHAKRHSAYQQSAFHLLYPQGGEPRVLNGPFAGMLYLNEPVWGSITPRWIGSYESCLWEVIQTIIRTGYRRIVDVGCAEGYYAAGLCRSSPTSEIHAFDLDRDSISQLRRLWEINGSPGRLHTGGLLDAAKLNQLGDTGDLLICDIEGSEMSLLDPAACSALLKMDILVEVHETGSAKVTANADELKRRFTSSHQITSIYDSQRAMHFEGVAALDEAQLFKAVSEGRPYSQVWLWMKSLH